MVRRSPSPNRRPIQQWEVREIGDAVEAWYEHGAPPPKQQKTASQKTQTKQPTRFAPPVLPEGHKSNRPIQKEEVKPLVEAAEKLVTGGEGEASKQELDDTVRALRIEEAIVKYAPQAGSIDVADKIRLDPKPHWVAAESYRLLPHDAPGQLQRRSAILAYENLRYLLHKARETGETFTSSDVLDYYHQFKRHELPADAVANPAEWEKKNLPVDFSMENLFAIAQRELLLGYKLKDEDAHLGELYQDTLSLHNLIEQTVVPALTDVLITPSSQPEPPVNSPPPATGPSR